MQYKREIIVYRFKLIYYWLKSFILCKLINFKVRPLRKFLSELPDDENLHYRLLKRWCGSHKYIINLYGLFSITLYYRGGYMRMKFQSFKTNTCGKSFYFGSYVVFDSCAKDYVDFSHDEIMRCLMHDYDYDFYKKWDRFLDWYHQ